MGKKIKRNCPNCGVEYIADETRLKHRHTVTCSRKCSYEYRGNKQRKRIKTACSVCDKPLELPPNRFDRGFDKLYCSQKCQHIGLKNGKHFWCLSCNKSFYRSKAEVSAKANKFCSHKCQGVYYTGENSPNYKGGTINKNGYRRIPKDGKNPYEHRYIMEQHLGRKLTKNEAVHHIDGNKLNNEIDNLMVLNYSEHAKLHYRLKLAKQAE